MGDIVGDVSRVLAGQHVDHQIGGQLGRQLGVVLEQLVGRADQGLRFGAASGRRLGDNNLLHLRLQVGLGAQQLEQAAPAHALHHHPHIVPRHPENLADVGDGAHLIQVVHPRLLHPDVLLAHQEHRTAGGHGRFQRPDGALPGHLKVDEHIGEHRQPPQGDGGHGGGVENVILFAHGCHVLLPAGRPGGRPLLKYTPHGPPPPAARPQAGTDAPRPAGRRCGASVFLCYVNRPVRGPGGGAAPPEHSPCPVWAAGSAPGSGSAQGAPPPGHTRR